MIPCQEQSLNHNEHGVKIKLSLHVISVAFCWRVFADIVLCFLLVEHFPKVCRAGWSVALNTSPSVQICWLSLQRHHREYSSCCFLLQIILTQLGRMLNEVYPPSVVAQSERLAFSVSGFCADWGCLAHDAHRPLPHCHSIPISMLHWWL